MQSFSGNFRQPNPEQGPHRMDQHTIEQLSGNLKILQNKDGYRYSIDPFLLVAFTRIPANAKVADLGSGSGIIALLLSQVPFVEKILGLELQPELVERARTSIALNDLQDRIEMIQGDVRSLPDELIANSFDAVLTNPPYRTARAGRIAKGQERSLARHELAGGLANFLRGASVLLRSGGHFYIVYLAERLPELMSEMRRLRLEPKRLRTIHSRNGERARLVLVEGRKNSKPGLTIEAPLVIYQGGGRNYSDEVREALIGQAVMTKAE